MVVSEFDIRNPRFIRYDSGATLSRDNGRRFDNMSIQYAGQPNRHWRIEPQPGYNAQDPVIRPDRIKLDVDAPVIRAR